MTTAKKSAKTSKMATSGGKTTPGSGKTTASAPAAMPASGGKATSGSGKAASGSGKAAPAAKSVAASTKTVSGTSKSVLETSAEPTSAAASAPATSGGKTVSGSGKAAPAAAPSRRSRRAKTTIPPNYTLPASAEIPRVSVTEVAPVVEETRFPAKAAIGEVFPVTATVFVEGHAQFGADAVLLRPVAPADRGESGYDIYEPLPHVDDPAAWEVVDRARMHEIGQGLNHFQAELQAKTGGRYAFAVESWVDPYLTWVHDAKVKIAAGVDVELMLEEGARLLERAIAGEAPRPVGSTAAAQPPLADADKAILQGAIAGLREARHAPEIRLTAATSDLVAAIFRETPLRDLATRTRLFPLRVDRERTLAGAWYEIFPRSIGSRRDADGKIVSGTLRTAAEILPDVAADGYDVLYLTPIHPIGRAFRKGKNATLHSAPDDPGSPWAIGNEFGGHEAIAPELGTLSDFDAFVEKARGLGLEVALDFALQCSPDHPWVKEHPEWFKVRADGTIAYAENPPKKYQDIYPLNFDNDPEGLYRAIRGVIEFWIDHGVTIFRMDNPHTKPVRFWQRLAADLQATHPEVVMLAEAFTKPAMMRGLAKAGFHLSYTYFTWRNGKQEITEYLEELAYETAHVLRPAFFPMTPDILTEYMTAGSAAFKARAVLAALSAPTWGILGGSYEFCENVPRPGVEEAIDNPKYEIKLYNWEARDQYGIASLNRVLNGIRRAHPALLQLRNIKFHGCDNENILVFSKHLDASHSPTGKDDTVLAVLNLDPHHTQEGWIYLDLPSLGLSPHEFGAAWRAENRGQKVFRVTDELSRGLTAPDAAPGAASHGQTPPYTFTWALDNFVSLNPAKCPAHVFSFSTLP